MSSTVLMRFNCSMKAPSSLNVATENEMFLMWISHHFNCINKLNDWFLVWSLMKIENEKRRLKVFLNTFNCQQWKRPIQCSIQNFSVSKSCDTFTTIYDGMRNLSGNEYITCYITGRQSTSRRIKLCMLWWAFDWFKFKWIECASWSNSIDFAIQIVFFIW